MTLLIINYKLFAIIIIIIIILVSHPALWCTSPAVPYVLALLSSRSPESTAKYDILHLRGRYRYFQRNTWYKLPCVFTCQASLSSSALSKFYGICDQVYGARELTQDLQWQREKVRRGNLLNRLVMLWSLNMWISLLQVTFLAFFI